MLLGVLWHVVFFAPMQPATGATAFAADAFLFGSHAFRMPLFFLVAGFFAAMVVGRRGGGAFLTGRLRRLGIPFLIGMVTVVPAFRALLAWRTARETGAPLDVDLVGWVTFGPAHLWFLEELLVFSAAAVLAGRRLPAPRAGWLPAFALASAVALWALSRWPHNPVHALLPAPASLAFHGVFFLCGWLAFTRRELVDVLMRHALVLGAMAFTATVGLAAAYDFREAAGSAAGPTLVVLETVACWGALAALMAGAARFVSTDRPALRYLADASYWIYLGHLPLVAGLLVILEPVGLALELATPLVFSVTCAVLLVTYDAFVRYGAVGALLHGPRERPLGSPAELLDHLVEHRQGGAPLEAPARGAQRVGVE